MSTFLITGGAGFIGSNIAEKLLKMGAKVRVMDNLLTGRRSNIAEFLDNPNFEFFEKDITNLAIGQKVIAYNNINPEKKYQAKIILISKDISPQGTAEVHCDLDVMDKSILPGMYMNAEIKVLREIQKNEKQ